MSETKIQKEAGVARDFLRTQNFDVPLQVVQELVSKLNSCRDLHQLQVESRKTTKEHQHLGVLILEVSGKPLFPVKLVRNPSADPDFSRRVGNRRLASAETLGLMFAAMRKHHTDALSDGESFFTAMGDYVGELDVEGLLPLSIESWTSNLGRPRASQLLADSSGVAQAKALAEALELMESLETFRQFERVCARNGLTDSYVELIADDDEPHFVVYPDRIGIFDALFGESEIQSLAEALLASASEGEVTFRINLATFRRDRIEPLIARISSIVTLDIPTGPLPVYSHVSAEQKLAIRRLERERIREILHKYGYRLWETASHERLALRLEEAVGDGNIPASVLTER